MIRKAAQAASMTLTGATVLGGSLWLISHRPGFLPYGWSQMRSFLSYAPAGYKLLLGVDLLLAAWAVGWTTLAGLSRMLRRNAWFSGLDPVRPPQRFLGGLLLVHLLVVLLSRANDFPPIVFTDSSLKVGGFGVYRWAATLIGGNAASLGLLVACAAVALWYLSGALGSSRHEDLPTPTVTPTRTWAKQMTIGSIEIIGGFALLMFLPIAAEGIARSFGPRGWFFWEREVIPFHLFGFSLSDHRFHLSLGSASWPAWVGLTLSLAVASWAFGWVASAAARRLSGLNGVSVRRAEKERCQAGKKALVWLLGTEMLLAVALPPEELGRFHLIFAPYSGDSPNLTSWGFGLDLWLGLVALVVVAAAVLHLGEAAFNWWDRRSGDTVFCPTLDV